MTAAPAPAIATIADHFKKLSPAERAAWRDALLPKSPAERISTLTPAGRREWYEGLSTDAAAWLPWDWKFWAQPSQLPPSGDWWGWLIHAGRGRGKTRIGAEQVRTWAEEARDRGKPDRFLLVGQTATDYRRVMVGGESGLLNISPPSWRPVHESSKQRVVWPDGTEGLLFSGDRPDQLRGPQGNKAWVDELAKFKYPTETWDNLELALRAGDHPQVVITTTPRPIPIILQLIDDPMVQVTRGNSLENLRNLAPIYIKRVILRFLGTRQGRQEIFGEILTDIPGALFTRTRFEANRIKGIAGKAPTPPCEMARIVIAVDPNASSDEDSNEAGLTACGLGTDGHGYLLDDRSGVYTPAKWAEIAVEMYYYWRADDIIGERNNGGEMVAHTISTQDASVPVHTVWASRGKTRRAQPIASLDEQGKIHHVGHFPELEDQLVQMLPDRYTGPGSPDRGDAYVWGFSALMLDLEDYDPDEWGSHSR